MRKQKHERPTMNQVFDMIGRTEYEKGKTVELEIHGCPVSVSMTVNNSEDFMTAIRQILLCANRTRISIDE